VRLGHDAMARIDCQRKAHDANRKDDAQQRLRRSRLPQAKPRARTACASPPRSRSPRTLAHIPAKWTPVRRQRYAPIKDSRACFDSAGTKYALVRVAHVLSEGTVHVLLVHLLLQIARGPSPGRRGLSACSQNRRAARGTSRCTNSASGSWPVGADGYSTRSAIDVAVVIPALLHG